MFIIDPLLGHSFICEKGCVIRQPDLTS